MPNPRPLAERFHEKYERVPESGCWIWTASRMAKGGYGKIVLHQGDQIATGAHRVSWILHNGPIPDGLWVLHQCDVPACVNPEHLFLGTAKDNNRDCAQKGRKAEMPRRVFYGPPKPRWLVGKNRIRKLKGRPDQKGEKNWNARLDWVKVADIRAKRVSRAEYSRLYGVCPKTISEIWSGRTWVSPSH